MARNSTSTARKSGTGSATGTTKESTAATTEAKGPVAGTTEKMEEGATAAAPWQIPFSVPDSEIFPPINGKLLNHASSLGGDLMSFGQKRFGSDLDTFSQLCRCNSPEQVSEVQREWLDKAAEDYRKDGIELFRSAGAFFSEAMQAPFQIFGAMAGNHRDEEGKSR